MERARAFCFTLNNYTEEELETVKAWDCRYLIFGKEVGESGTPHLQGYVCFANAKTISALKKYSKRAHWEVARGTPKQAADYCSKDGDVFEKGDRPLSQIEKGQVEKDRWLNAFNAVKEGRIEDLEPELKCRMLKNIEYAVYRERVSKRKVQDLDGELQHEWIVGRTGVGKSRTARAENPGAYIKDPTSIWWDGYTDEEVVIIDDFDKYQIRQVGDMKRLLDRYAYPVQFKGGMQMIRPLKVVVTSQYHPSQIWEDEESYTAMMRRVKIREM